MGVCKTPVHNILQKLLIIRVVNFAKGTSRMGKKLWQSVVIDYQGYQLCQSVVTDFSES